LAAGSSSYFDAPVAQPRSAGTSCMVAASTSTRPRPPQRACVFLQCRVTFRSRL
jgi:hypothetical protein